MFPSHDTNITYATFNERNKRKYLQENDVGIQTSVIYDNDIMITPNAKEEELRILNEKRLKEEQEKEEIEKQVLALKEIEKQKEIEKENLRLLQVKVSQDIELEKSKIREELRLLEQQKEDERLKILKQEQYPDWETS